MSGTPDSHIYSGKHIHPMDPTVIEIVAYERLDGEWDVFVCEPPGSCPEYEAARIDNYHMYVERIASHDMLNAAVDRIEAYLGEAYRRVPYYRETGSRRIIQRIRDHLHAHQAGGMFVHSEPPDNWVLYIRRKDISLAQEVAVSNA
jgi:hypothetical protein